MLAAYESDDRVFALNCVLIELFPVLSIEHELFVDSKALFDTFTVLHS